MSNLKNFLGYAIISAAIIILYLISRQHIGTSDTIIPKDARVTISFLNIGEGDSIYIRTNTGEDILIDGGPVPYRSGQAPVLKELSDVMPLTDKEFDLVIASHNHADHLGGLIEILKKYRAKEIWISGAVHTTATYMKWLEVLRSQKENGADIKKVKLGDQKNLGRIKLAVFHPIIDMEGQSPKDQHDATVAVKMTDGNVSILLSGDLNETHEQNILDAFKDNETFLRSQILKIPHSGSKSSLLPDFLKIINPEIAIISVGSNSYGHPAPSILNKLESAGIKIFRTDKTGRITIVSDGHKYELLNKN